MAKNKEDQSVIQLLEVTGSTPQEYLSKTIGLIEDFLITNTQEADLIVAKKYLEKIHGFKNQLNSPRTN